MTSEENKPSANRAADGKAGAQKELEGALLVADVAEVGFEDDEDWGDDDGGSPGDGKAEEAMEFLSGLLFRMGLDARVSVRKDGRKIVLDVSGEDAGRAIGKKGQTLDALQFITNKVMSRSTDRRRYVIVDSGDYRERHDENLLMMAKREAKRAVDSGRTVTLEPMPARDRRIIHLSLAKLTGVATKSHGEGMGRRIQIIPAGATGAPDRSDGRRERDRGRGRRNERGAERNTGGDKGRTESSAPQGEGPIFIGEGIDE